MLAATTRGTIVKTEFLWIIRDTFKWPEKKGESLNSPSFYAVNDEGIKWTIKIQKDTPTYGNGYQDPLCLFLCLSECPASEPTVATRFSITVSDEKEGKLLHERKSSHIPSIFSKLSGHAEVSFNGHVPMGNREEYLKISSILIRVTIEYEKGQLVAETPKSILSVISSKSSWSEDFENLFISQSGSDICFIIDGQEIKAHKTVLSARSPVFAAMFHSNMKEKGMSRIDIPDVSQDIFNALLHFMYTDRVQLTETSAELLLAAADKYLLASLKSKCEEFIIKYLTIENCSRIMDLADLHNSLRLKNKTQELFRSRHIEIRKTDGWKDLKISHPDVALDVVEQLLDLVR